MQRTKRILLCFNANIAGYRVIVYDGARIFQKTVYSKKERLCVCAPSPCLRVVARPLTGGSLLYFWITTACNPVCSLYFNFPQTPSPPLARNIFTLTDANYGLPVDGALLFTET